MHVSKPSQWAGHVMNMAGLASGLVTDSITKTCERIVWETGPIIQVYDDQSQITRVLTTDKMIRAHADLLEL